MFFHLQSSDVNIPIYLKIYYDIKNQIVSYKYLTNELLPSEHELARIYNVTRPTVQKALQMLVNERLVTRQRGRGTYVCPLTVQESLDSSVLHLGGINNPDVLITRYHYIFSQRVMELTDGKIKIAVHHSAEFGDGATQIERVRTKQQDMFGAAVEWLELVEPLWSITSYPFLFRSLAELQTFVKSGLNQQLKAQLVKVHGMRVLADNWYRPSRVCISRRPYFRLKELENQRMAVCNIPFYRELWDALGMQTVPCQWRTEAQAFQDDLIDAMDAPLDAILDIKLYRYAPYLLQTNHLYSRACIMINEETFQSFRSDLQQALIQAAEESGRLFAAQTRQSRKKMENQFIQNGGAIIRINTDEFCQRTNDVFTQNIRIRYPQVYNLYQKIQKGHA